MFNVIQYSDEIEKVIVISQVDYFVVKFSEKHSEIDVVRLTRNV